MDENKTTEQNDEVMGLDNCDADELLYLSSKEGDIFSLNKKCASISTLVVTILDGDSIAGSTNDYAIQIKQVSSICLKLIVEYMSHHGGEDKDIPPQPVRFTEMIKVCKDPWDAKFCNDLIPDNKNNDDLELNLLFEVIMAANYMDMKPLLYKLCAKVATQLKGKKLEDIPKILKSVTRYKDVEEYKE